MAKEPAMKCEDNGHDSRTCNCCTGIRLFGVQINVADDNGKKNWESLMRKSKSLGNLEACNVENTLVEAAYHSDGFMHQSSISKEGHERKRGKPWSEEEHRSFLVGLEKLGKGDWKGISKNYVPSRTSSQVASHAQKYFIRLSATEKKRRRSSVFDISLIEKNASASLGSPSNKAFEISPHTSSSDAALKNLGEFERQASMQPPATTSEKRPLSPMPKLHGITNFGRVAPYMHVNSLGSPSNKAFEISPHTSSSDAALKNLGEFERQAIMQPPATTSEKRPLSSMPKRHGITNFGRVAPYMAGVSCINAFWNIKQYQLFLGFQL